jgi:hypothetical protein
MLIYAYANNPFAGHVPATIQQFRNLWHSKGLPEIESRSESEKLHSLLNEAST